MIRLLPRLLGRQQARVYVRDMGPDAQSPPAVVGEAQALYGDGAASQAEASDKGGVLPVSALESYAVAAAGDGKGTPLDPLVFQTRNAERARFSGFEVKVVYDCGRVAGGRLSTPFSYCKTRGSNRDNGKPLNSIEPAQLALGVQYDTAPWSLRLDARHHAAKQAKDIDNASAVKAPNTQFTIPSATTLDVSGQWRIRKDIRLNLAVRNLTDRKYWLWPDVQGLAASSNANDAYTQPGRSAHVSLVMDF